jgi:uncharacterized membrane protein YoaK (UPF0700 family)
MHLAIWAALMTGAVGGGAAYTAFGIQAVIAPAALASLLAVASLIVTLGWRPRARA